MERRTHSPAVLAGLVAGAATLYPTHAQALTVFGAEVPADDPVITFVAGCAVGAVVASGTTFALGCLDRRREAAAQAPTQAAGGAPDHVAGHARVRHARRQSWEETGTIRVQRPEAQTRDFAATATPKPPSGEDLTDVAEDYVRGVTLARRMAARARGVASVLGERLGASCMKDLPVIERADGTVGDVGEKWWDDATGVDEQYQQSLADITGTRSITDELEDNSALLYTNQVPLARRAPAPAPSAPQAPSPQPGHRHADGLDRATIAERVASPAEAFPEHGRWSEQDRDLWQVALDALDERTDEQLSMDGVDASGVFSDGVGSSSSLDEPDGLEASTQFLTFRPQAGHPEVTDTDSYVDLLINQEFSRNASPAARRTFHDYLTLIDGGTSAGHLAAQQA